MAAEEKRRLREEMRGRLRSLPPEVRAAKSTALRLDLLGEPEFRAARRVFAFFPLPSEPDLLGAPLAHQEIFLPRIFGAELRFHLVGRGVCRLDQSGLEAGPAGVRQPTGESPQSRPSDGDIVLVPGLAFSPAGERLGRGGGFYDRFLSSLTDLGVRAWGACFSCQIVGALPTEPFDRRVGRVFFR